jgi:long-chain acyl-CoA synthetase
MSTELTPGADAAPITAAFFGHAVMHPQREALCCDGRSISYGELAQLVCRLSHGLARRGVNSGDRIGVVLQNSIEFVALILAAADLGAALAPLSPGLTPAAIERAFAAASVRHVVARANILGTLLDELPKAWSAVDGLWLSVDEPVGHALALPQLLTEGGADAAPLHAGCGSDALILTMTSGSTGAPKPIVLTQRTKFNRARAAVLMYGVSEQDRTLAATPLYHSLAERLVLIPLLTGGTSVLMSGFTATTWLQAVAKERVSFTIAVSSQLKQIAAAIDAAGRQQCADLSTLRCLVSSSALLDTAVKADLLAKFSCEFHECYGTSEIGIAANLGGAAARDKLASVGHAAPGVEIGILGDDGRLLESGQAGEIVCKTDMLFGGYFQRPEQTAAAMWGEYFRTGDIGRLDADGFLTFLGRAKDVIISGGINIYPSDIEEVLATHASVKECAAFAYADERLGEVVAVAIVPHDAATMELRQLRFHCAARLADFQQPRQYFIVASLPKNDMGKLMKYQLVTIYANANQPRATPRSLP